MTTTFKVFQPRFASEDYLDRLGAGVAMNEILALRQQRGEMLASPTMKPYRDAVNSIQDLPQVRVDLSQDVIRIGQAEDLNGAQAELMLTALKTFCPWKKGPFEIFGHLIDAEWRSHWKWQRILPQIGSLQGKKVADIGCHNGYFMFRMADQLPDWVIGFEPVAKHYWNFQLLQTFIQQPHLVFELLGVEHIDLYPRFFDTIFCLGILYHHTDPVGLLRKIKTAIAPGGEVIIDCQGIQGDLPVALTPQKRYAKAKGIWFLPTQSCLENWIRRAGFQSVEIFFAEPLSVEEQRRTAWADVDSLQDFLDPRDPSLTIEGYPAPWRYYAIAK